VTLAREGLPPSEALALTLGQLLAWLAARERLMAGPETDERRVVEG
jgi:hypothetical protein